MGIVYKIKEEIVQFILEEKKSNPAVSCRQLANLSNDRFNVEISKSSINTILKKAQLSSDVGRRSADSKTKIFKIPAVKKKQILEHMAKVGFEKKEEIVSQKIEPLPEIKMEEIKNEVVVEEFLDQDNVLKEKGLPLLADPIEHVVESSIVDQTNSLDSINREVVSLAEAKNFTEENDDRFLEKIDFIRREIKNQYGPVLDGMGVIFLKAAQWDLYSKSILAELINKHKKFLHNDSLGNLCDSWAMLSVFGSDYLKSVNRFYNHGALALHGFSHWDGINDFEQKIKDLVLPKSFYLEYLNEKNQAKLCAKENRLILKDKTSIILDSNLKTFAQSNISVPINKALDLLSYYVIANRDILCLGSIDESGFSSEFYNFASFFENLEEKAVMEASVWGDQNEELARFSLIPKKKRLFMLSGSAIHKDIKGLEKTLHWARKQPIYLSYIDKVYYYSETKANLPSSNIECRVISLWEDKEKEVSLSLLTNEHNKSGEELINKYSIRWPNLMGLSKEMNDNKEFWAQTPQPTVVNKEISSEEELFDDFIEHLHKYCREHFLPAKYQSLEVKNLASNLYSLLGSIREKDNILNVILQIPSGYKYLRDLEFAVNRVNQGHIKDFKGKRLFISLEKLA